MSCLRTSECRHTGTHYGREGQSEEFLSYLFYYYSDQDQDNKVEQHTPAIASETTYYTNESNEDQGDCSRTKIPPLHKQTVELRQWSPYYPSLDIKRSCINDTS